MRAGSSAVNLFYGFRRDRSGATAIEFAAVSMPFFMFAFGMFGVGWFYLVSTSLDHAVETASREIRTGEVNDPANNGGQTLTVDEFKQRICDAGVGTIDCSLLEVHVNSGQNWADINPPSCLDGNGVLTQTTGGSAANGGGNSDSLTDHGGCAGEAYVVTACYEFTPSQFLPFFDIGNMGNGSSVIQSAAAGRSEPHQFTCN